MTGEAVELVGLGFEENPGVRCTLCILMLSLYIEQDTRF
jgi:hypothetical protein